MTNKTVRNSLLVHGRSQHTLTNINNPKKVRFAETYRLRLAVQSSKKIPGRSVLSKLLFIANREGKTMFSQIFVQCNHFFSFSSETFK